MDRPEHRVVISGVGRSRLGRRIGETDLALTLAAIVDAVRDAGLTMADVDGLATFPGDAKAYSPGFVGANIAEVHDALRLQLGWHLTSFQGPGQMGPIASAVLAVAAGLCRHAVIYRTVTEATGQGSGPRQGQLAGAESVGPPYNWLFPVGGVSPVSWIALYATRYLETYGATREQLGWVPVVQRRHAARNPRAVLRDPMSLDDYLGARMISSPFGLYDCDIPVDGSTAFVVSAADTVPDLRAPVRIDAMATAMRGRPLWEQWEDMTTSATRDVGAQLWSRSELKPTDVDVAHFYDGFSIFPLFWLESFGFCGPGEAAAFVEGGTRIDLGGELPINPHGGQLSEGRLHGFGVLAEAVTQVRNEAGPRQVEGAEVTVAGVGGGVMVGGMLLTQDR